MIRELDNKKLSNIIRGLLTKENEPEIIKLVDVLNDVETYISELEMDNINLSIKLNNAIENYLWLKKDASRVISILKPEIEND